MKEKTDEKKSTLSFESVIELIKQADSAAKENAGAVEKEKENILHQLDSKKIELREKYEERAKRRIEIVENEEKKFADTEIEKSREELEKRLKALEDFANKNNETWSEQMYKEVLK